MNTLAVKTGKRAPRLDLRTLKLAQYLPAILPPPPAEVSWVTHVPSWPMLLNDSLGDCVPAAAGHMVQQWTTYAHSSATQGDGSFTPSDHDILKVYEVIGGYIPGEPSTDNGAFMLDMLNYWRKTGIAGHKIVAYVAVDLARVDEIKTAIQLFGSLYLGIQLPLSVQGANRWIVPDGGAYGDGSPGTWGGHCIPVFAASPQTLTCVTWGSTLKMSWNFLKDYADEAYCVLSQDWIDKNGLSPSQLNLAQLLADLTRL